MRSFLLFTFSLLIFYSSSSSKVIANDAMNAYRESQLAEGRKKMNDMHEKREQVKKAKRDKALAKGKLLSSKTKEEYCKSTDKSCRAKKSLKRSILASKDKKMCKKFCRSGLGSAGYLIRYPCHIPKPRCSSIPKIVGCIDKNSINYDKSATHSDKNKCRYRIDHDGEALTAEEVAQLTGCKDRKAVNYFAKAAFHDKKKCVYSNQVNCTTTCQGKRIEYFCKDGKPACSSDRMCMSHCSNGSLIRHICGETPQC
jgi:hypothetical protein